MGLEPQVELEAYRVGKLQAAIGWFVCSQLLSLVNFSPDEAHAARLFHPTRSKIMTVSRSSPP
jgi:hypothetical protein